MGRLSMWALLLGAACAPDAQDGFLYGPSVAIEPPDAGVVVDQPVVLLGTAVDADGQTPNADLVVLWNWTATDANQADTVDGDPPDDDDVVRWEWTPDCAGATVITLTVRDGDGGQGQDSVHLTVQQVDADDTGR